MRSLLSGRDGRTLSMDEGGQAQAEDAKLTQQGSRLLDPVTKTLKMQLKRTDSGINENWKSIIRIVPNTPCSDRLLL